MGEKKEPSTGSTNDGDSIAQTEQKLISLMIDYPSLYKKIKPVREVFSFRHKPLLTVISGCIQEDVLLFLASNREEMFAHFSALDEIRTEYPEFAHAEEDRYLYARGLYQSLLLANKEKLEPKVFVTEYAKKANSINPAFLSFLELLETMETMEFLVNPFLPKGALVALCGDGGSGKTWLALYIASRLSSGLKVFGMDAKKTVCLIVDEESGTTRLKDRMLRIKEKTELEPTNLFFASYTGFSFDQPDSIEALKRAIQAYHAGFCVIDPLVDVIPGDENSSRDMNLPLKELRRIASETNCTILLLHHTNKSGGYRGSSAIKAAVDALYIMESAPTETGAKVKIHAEKTRDMLVKQIELELCWTGGFSAEIAGRTLDSDDKDILRAMGTGSTIHTLQKLTGFTKNFIHARLKKQLSGLFTTKGGRTALYAISDAGEAELTVDSIVSKI